MHIPKQDTAGIDVLSFEEALAAAQRPQADYDVSRWLYVPPTYEEYRYILGTRGVHPLICVGINPSTAEPDRLDPTLQSAQRIARFNGYDSLLTLCRGTPAVWAAWGSIIEKRAYLSACVADMLEIAGRQGAVWYHAGALSKAGHPHHPLYLRADTRLEPFDTGAYLARLAERTPAGRRG